MGELDIGLGPQPAVEGTDGILGNHATFHNLRIPEGVKTAVAASTSSVVVLAPNSNRVSATFYNDSTAICYLDLTGGTASSTSYSVQVAANGGYYELSAPYQGQISAVWAAANGNLMVTEFS